MLKRTIIPIIDNKFIINQITRMNPKFNLEKHFNALQNEMVAKLNKYAEIKHPGTKGELTENSWILWLRDYLPKRYSVDTGFVIDSKGGISHQIDLLIYDQQYSPFIFSEGNMKFIPAESVYGVFEVKQNVTSVHIHYAADKVNSVRELYRTSAAIIDRGDKKSPRPLTKIMGGLLTRISSIKTENVIKEHLSSYSGLYGLDIGCAIEDFAFYVDYKYDAPVKSKKFLCNDFYDKRTTSPSDVQMSNKDNSLITFFFQLNRYLQQSIGTVCAIDLAAYYKAIDSKFELDEDL